jgi:hypothetical protein
MTASPLEKQRHGVRDAETADSEADHGGHCLADQQHTAERDRHERRADLVA